MTILLSALEPERVAEAVAAPGLTDPRDAATDNFVVFLLPMPPSTNGLWANGKNRRFRTQNYEDWLHAAGWELKRQRVPAVSGPVSIRYEVEEPKTRRRMDLANREKAATDLLVSNGIIEADDQRIVREINLSWSREVSGVRVTIKPIE